MERLQVLQREGVLPEEDCRIPRFLFGAFLVGGAVVIFACVWCAHPLFGHCGQLWGQASLLGRRPLDFFVETLNPKPRFGWNSAISSWVGSQEDLKPQGNRVPVMSRVDMVFETFERSLALMCGLLLLGLLEVKGTHESTIRVWGEADKQRTYNCKGAPIGS